MFPSFRSASPVVSYSAAALVWIILLVVWLRWLLGTEVSPGWLAVGLTVTLLGLGILVVVKEFMDAIQIPEHPVQRHSGSRGFVLAKNSTARTNFTTRRLSVDPIGFQSQRITLGLPPRYLLANRRR
jgi:hypothetical protein